MKKKKLKTHKSLLKRLRVTAKGKILHRKCGQNHYNVPESSKTTREKRKMQTLSKIHKKTIRKLLHF